MKEKKAKKHDTARTVALGTLVLSISGILVKAVGLLFKIPLTNMIGESGMGYFGSAYMIYSFFYVISTAGLPVALSILVSSARARGDLPYCRRIMDVAMRLFSAIGLALSLLMFFGAKNFAAAISNPGAAQSIAFLSPTVFFVCVISAYRGYFQGFEYMLPTAVSQITEALGKLFFGLMLAGYAMKNGKGVETVAAYATLGISISEALSMLSLMICKISFREDRVKTGECADSTSAKWLIKRLVKTAFPITASSAVMSLSGLLDLAVVMRRLQHIGYTPELSNALYGSYTALAVPLFNLPSVLITPLACSVVPYIARAVASGDRGAAGESVRKALKYAVLISLPCSLGLYVMAEPVLSLIFGESAASGASLHLSLLSIAIPFVALTSVTVSVIQASGHTSVPIVSMTVGALFKLVSAWVLIGLSGMAGAPISTVICYSVISLIDLSYMENKMNMNVGLLRLTMMPLISAFISASAAHILFVTFESRFGSAACLFAVAAAAVIYFAAVLVCGYVDIGELEHLPVVGKLFVKIRRKMKKRKSTNET